MSDGIRLLALVEVLSGKKLPRYNQRPTMKAQKLNNVDMALQFLKDEEKIKLVNISSSDIVDGNLKLILGLMWTLILHYSISMPVWEGEDDFDPSLTPKQRLLKWIQNKIPDVPVNNFTTDWNDGKAIGALVDSVAPGLCPDWKDWKPEDSVKNVGTALQQADDWLDVPQLIKPKEMTNRKVDELSMMTYLSQFPGAKVKQNAPLRSSAGNPARVRCYGPGLQATGVVVGAETHFTVETFSAGKGDVEVIIENPNKANEPVQIKFNDDKNMTYTCTYVATMEGEHTITVKFNKTEVPKSPFAVTVKGIPLGDGYKKCKASGPGIEPSGKVRAGQQTYIDIFTQGAGAGQVEVIINDPQGKPSTCPCRLRKMSADKYKAEYVADEAGQHSISILFAGKPIPQSPFGVNVDPFKDVRKVKSVGRGLQPNGLRVGDTADFEVSVDGAGEGELEVKIIGPEGSEEKVNIKQDKDKKTKFNCDWKPQKEGEHKVIILYGGEEAKQFDVNVAKPSSSKVIAYGPGLHGGCVGFPSKFIIDTKGEKGTLGIECNGPSEAKIECHDLGNGLASVEWTVPAPGTYAIHVTSNGDDIPNSPSCAKIQTRKQFDPKKFDSEYEKKYSSEFKLWSQERRSSSTTKQTTTTTTTTTTSAAEEQQPKQAKKIISGLPSVVTIKMSDLTDLHAYIESPSKERKECQLIPKENGTLTISFTPQEAGEHLVHLLRGEKTVGGSPFKITVEGKTAGDSTKVKVIGDGCKTGELEVENSFLIDIREAGKGKIGVSMHGPSKAKVDVLPESTAGIFKVVWKVTEAGKYDLNLRFDDAEIPGSPFVIKVKKNKADQKSSGSGSEQ